jgi:Cu+-exporting ATPase
MSDCFRGRRATRRPLDTQPHGRRGRHRRQDRLHRDAALEASDLTLVRGDLIVAADAVRLSRRTLRIIRSNLCWAFAHNVAALPLAAAGDDQPDDHRSGDGVQLGARRPNGLRLSRFTSVTR